jgi:O-antigen/teichoic acid export membrane protein
LGILVLGRPAIWILAGSEFLPAYPVTVLLAFGIIPMSWFKIVGTLLLAQGKKYVYLGMLTASVAVNIICNMLTIPLWGTMLYVRKHVKDPAFHNSIQYVLHFLLIPLSLFLALLPWMAVEEWMYQLRQFKLS